MSSIYHFKTKEGGFSSPWINLCVAVRKNNQEIWGQLSLVENLLNEKLIEHNAVCYINDKYIEFKTEQDKLKFLIMWS